MANLGALQDFRGDPMDPPVTRGHRISVSAHDGLFEVQSIRPLTVTWRQWGSTFFPLMGPGSEKRLPGVTGNLFPKYTDLSWISGSGHPNVWPWRHWTCCRHIQLTCDLVTLNDKVNRSQGRFIHRNKDSVAADWGRATPSWCWLGCSCSSTGTWPWSPEVSRVGYISSKLFMNMLFSAFFLVLPSNCFLHHHHGSTVGLVNRVGYFTQFYLQMFVSAPAGWFEVSSRVGQQGWLFYPILFTKIIKMEITRVGCSPSWEGRWGGSPSWR